MEHNPAILLNASNILKPTVDLRKIGELNEYICSVIGICLNLLLCYLILCKTTSRLRVYKRVLLQNCLLDIFYNIVNGLTHCQGEFKAGNFFVLLNGPFQDLPIPWGAYCIGLWVFALFLCVTGVPIQFVFRYFLLVKKRLLTKLEYFSLLGISCFLALVYAIAWTYVCWLTPEEIHQKSVLLAKDPYYYSGIPTFLSSEIWNINMQFVFFYCYSLVAGSYMIIIFTSIRVYQHLSRSVYISPEILDIHKQITTTLMVQAVAPVVVCLLPIVLLVSGCFLYLDIPGAGLIINFLFGWIPLANSTITIVAIKTYRQFCFGWIKTIKYKIYRNS